MEFPTLDLPNCFPVADHKFFESRDTGPYLSLLSQCYSNICA